MNVFNNLTALRKQSQWLAIMVSFVMVAGALSLTALWPSGNFALNNTSGGDLKSVFGTYQGPQQCGECHEAEFNAWTNTTHSQASFDPIFQVYLQGVEKPGECFACHATGYDTVTGQYVTAGVTCEACHGPYRPEHPGESMMVAAPEELCGHCHTSTVTEWRSSRHGQVGITCVACHEVHTQKTRVTEATDLLCANCHQSDMQDATHAVHSQAGVRCIDCHLARPDDIAESAVSGHAITSHSFTVSVSTCEDCHSETSYDRLWERVRLW